MANLNLGQDVATKREKYRQLLIGWQNLFPYSKLSHCIVTFLLLTLTPLICVCYSTEEELWKKETA